MGLYSSIYWHTARITWLWLIWSVYAVFYSVTEFLHRDTLMTVKTVVLVSATGIYTWNVHSQENFSIGIHWWPSKQLYWSLPQGLAPTMYTVQIPSQNFSIGIHWRPSKQLYWSLPQGLAPKMYTVQISSQNFSIGIHWWPSKQLYSSLPQELAPKMNIQDVSIEMQRDIMNS